MALLRTYTLSGTNPRMMARLDPAQATLSQLIDGDFRLPFGGSFWVHETVTMRFSLLTPNLVDVDFQWYAPKFFIGNWELIEEFGSPSGVIAEYPKLPDGHGFISSFNQRIRFSTEYLVRGIDSGFPFESGRIELDQCNFVLIPRPPSISPLLPPGQAPAINSGLFKGLVSESEHPPIDRAIDARANLLGVFVKPGLSLDSVEHEMSASKSVFLNLLQASTPLCNLGNDCDTEFDIFVRSINNGEPIDSGATSTAYGVFSTEQECNLVVGIGCGASTFTCSSGEERIYYTPFAN